MRESLKDSPYEAHIRAEDANKGGSDRHVAGIHTWNKLTEKPEAYVLGYSLISSGSGKDQAKAEFHVISKQFGVTNVGAMIGDNAKTQTGNKRGLVKMNSQLFDNKMFSMGCYPLSLTLSFIKHVNLHLVPKVTCRISMYSKCTTKFAGSFMQNQNSTNQCMQTWAFWKRHLHYHRCVWKQDENTFIIIWSGIRNMRVPV